MFGLPIFEDSVSEMKELEAERARFVVRMEPVGVFSALDVPERVGPTWSRRSGLRGTV